MRVRFGQVCPGHCHGGLGRPVGIEQTNACPDVPDPPLHECRKDALPADDHGLHCFGEGQLLQIHARHDFVPVGGREVEHRQVPLAAALQKSRHRIDHHRRAQHQGRPGGHAGENFLCGGIETHRREL